MKRNNDHCEVKAITMADYHLNFESFSFFLNEGATRDELLKIAMNAEKKYREMVFIQVMNEVPKDVWTSISKAVSNPKSVCLFLLVTVNNFGSC